MPMEHLALMLGASHVTTCIASSWTKLLLLYITNYPHSLIVKSVKKMYKLDFYAG